MVLPSTGSLSFSQIEQEFGELTGNNLGAFRISQTVGGMSNLPLDEGIGQEKDDGTSNSIRFSQFRGKRLNVVVSYDTTNTGGNERATYAKRKYDDDDDITVIGGFKDRPDDTSGSKIIIHVHNNVSLGSNKISRKHCALRTGGGWESGTVLEIDIGKNAMVSGAGGNGGNGGRPFSNDGNGNSGENGSSAIGIAFPVNKITIQEGAIVRAGAGGGGGGGGAAGEGHPQSDERVGGAGGGGGVGIPAGLGGVAGSNPSDGGTAYDNVEQQPQNGGNGSQTSGGNGGFGGLNNEGDSDNTPTAQSGGGGGGGFLGEGGGSYTNRGESNKIDDFTIRWSGTFVTPGTPPTKNIPGSEANSGEGGASFDWNDNSSDNYALRDGTLGWESTEDTSIEEDNVKMDSVSGSGSGFRVDIKYSPHQKAEDVGTTNFQTKIEITAIRDKGGGYSVGDALTTEYWTDNAISPDGTEANRRIINVSALESSSNNSGTGGDGNIIDAGAGDISGKGGDGGNGDAEGSNQEKGNGGSGGLGGYAIVTKNNAPVPTVGGDGFLIGTTIEHANDFEI